jgi:hypothetical protein
MSGSVRDLGRGLLDRLTNADIGHAATKIAGHDCVDVLVARRRKVLQQGSRLHDLAGLAIAALWHLKRNPSPLQRMLS